MAVGFTFKLTGAAELAKNLRALSDAVTKEVLSEALKKAAEPMRAQMAALAPRGPDGPHLADSMAIGAAKADKDSGGGWYVPIGPTKDFFYGYFLEFGTRRMHARPFMRPAFDGGVTQARDILGRELWAAVSSKASAGGTGNL